jgi:hypothetical protein
MLTLETAIEKFRQLPPEQRNKAIEFIELLESQSSHQQQNTNEINADENSDFFELAGIWENADITAEALRQEAWSKDR